MALHTARVTYLWRGPGGFQSSLRNPSIANMTKAKSGIYTITFRPLSNLNCIYVSHVEVSTTNCAGRIASAEEEGATLQLEVAPNPTRGRLAVAVTLPEAGALTLQWIDVQGRVCKEWLRAESSVNHRVELDVSDKAAGLYLLTAQSGPYRVAKRVIKIE